MAKMLMLTKRRLLPDLEPSEVGLLFVEAENAHAGRKQLAALPFKFCLVV